MVVQAYMVEASMVGKVTPQHSAGAGPLTAHGWNVEQILVYIWQLLSGEQTEQEYPYERFAASDAGQRLRIELDALNARLAAAPTGQTDLRPKAEFGLESVNGRHAQETAQDLARLEARLDEHNRFFAVRHADRINQLEAELTLLRAQQ